MSELNDFRMPALGADMEKGTVLEWRVKPGDQVRRGQIVAEVDTAKSAIEIEVFTDGVVDEILVPPGREVAVGTVLARLRPTPVPAAALASVRSDTTEPAGPPKLPAAAPTAAPPLSPVLRHLAKQLDVDLAQITGTGRNGKITRADIEAAVRPSPVAAEPTRFPSTGVRASPLARRRAAALGVELVGLSGTGPGGAVTVADVEAVRAERPRAAEAIPAITERPPTPTRVARGADRQAAMRQAIGALMSRSKREIPHYYLSTTIDLHAALAWLARVNADLPVSSRLLPAAMLLKATARAAQAYPEVNGHFVDDQFRPATGVRLGLPVSLRAGGLVTPAIDGAEMLTLPELNQRLRDVATRAKSGKLRGSEIEDPSITVTNLGDQGVEAVFGVIFAPQVALVGFGSIVERPWAVDGLLGVRPVVTATLSADHRVSDGHRGALFLQAIADHLDQPEQL
jgi:pyruvate dehydrogenase E2 component (dihydrolipoamide acetyltransferase)